MLVMLRVVYNARYNAGIIRQHLAYNSPQNIHTRPTLTPSVTWTCQSRCQVASWTGSYLSSRPIVVYICHICLLCQWKQKSLSPTTRSAGQSTTQQRRQDDNGGLKRSPHSSLRTTSTLPTAHFTISHTTLRHRTDNRTHPRAAPPADTTPEGETTVHVTCQGTVRK